MTTYVWGQKFIPYPILDETDDLVKVDINGAPTVLPIDRIVGRASDGDRVEILTTGGYWMPGTVSGYNNYLEVTLDSGVSFELAGVRNLRVVR